MNESTNKRFPAGTKTRQHSASQLVAEHGKIPPQALELEEAVLGAIMLEKNALTAVIDILKADVFYKEAHQLIFSAITRLFNRSEPIDILTVTQDLKKEGDLDIVGGPYYISQLTNRVASSANVEFHARILLQKYIQRELIRISSEIIRDSFEDTSDVFDILDKAEQELFSISENNFRRDYDNMHHLVREAIEDIENARKHDGNLRGVPSGYTSLDRITAGWQGSDLIVLAARPGMGKTAFALSMARNIAVDFKKAVAVFSLEMSAVQLVTRLISAETELPADKLKKGNLEDYEWEQLNTKVSNLIDAPILIDDTPALSIFELRAKCRRLKAQHDIQMVIIDYIQLMSTANSNAGNREQEISHISRSLKSLAKELDIPVLTLSQLNRSVETRGGSKKPILSDLRESGAIEQDADMVLFIYRPEYYKIDEDDKGPTRGMADIIIAKHRNGALADIRMRFIDKFARFEELDEPLYGTSDLADDPSGGIRILPSRMNDMSDDDLPY
ncbi:MAG: replicative DNA helicase [Bacteroidales bacterium]|nr:replicative DNA helicase [Bacteroidales bacterium]